MGCGPFGLLHHIGHVRPIPRHFAQDPRMEPYEQQPQRVQTNANPESDLLETLKKRFVNGEISEEEYRRMKQILIEE